MTGAAKTRPAAWPAGSAKRDRVQTIRCARRDGPGREGKAGGRAATALQSNAVGATGMPAARRLRDEEQ